MTFLPAVDLHAQYLTIKDDIDSAIARVLWKGNFCLGGEVAAFEKEFAAYCGAAYGVGVASGTDAIHLALRALGIGAGDEVITVSHTAVGTIVGIEATGATPVFVDVDPASYTMNPDGLDAVITNRTRAIVPVHLYGQPADMYAIKNVADHYDLFVIEDCAQAHGAEYEGRRVGSLGYAACFSFYPTKNLGAYGDGGMVVCNHRGLAYRIMELRQYGWNARYISTHRGFNSRLDEIQAAILRAKLKHLDKWIDSRRKIASVYNDAFGIGSVEKAYAPIEMAYAKHVYHLYVIRREKRALLRERLTAAGVTSGIHYPVPLHLQPAYTSLGYQGGDFPVAETLANEVLSLPVFPEMTIGEQRTIIELVRNT